MAVQELRMTETRYPNLVEEIRLREGQQRRNLVSRILNAANITEKLLAAVIAYGEELSNCELSNVAHVLDRPVDYLKSDKLKAFDVKNCDKEAYSAFRAEFDVLAGLKRHIEKMGVKIGNMSEYHFKNATNFCETVTSGKATPYAHYLFAVDSMHYADDLLSADIRRANITKRPPPRDVKREFAKASGV